MAQTKLNPIVHALPSLTDVAFLMPIAFMFAKLNGAKALLGDGDTGWHIRAGEWILANGRVPRHDIFSFTKPGQPWFAWEWLSDVVYAWLHQRWGLAGVVLLGMLVLSLTAALVYRLARRKSGNSLIAIAFTYLAVAASSVHWHARPHLFTMLFVAVVMTVLDRVAEGRRRLLWILPPLVLLWTNLHGGFFVGIFFVCCYGAGEIVRWFAEADAAAGRAALRRSMPYFATAAACAAASLCNPYGYRLHLFIFDYLRSPFLDTIGEFMSVSFRSPGAINFELLLLPSVATIGWTLRQRRYAQALIVASWSHLALIAGRNIPLFAIAAAPIAAEAFAEILDCVAASGISRRVRNLASGFIALTADIGAVENAWRIHALSAVAFLFIAAGVSRPGLAREFSAEFDADRFPVNAVPTLERQGLGRMFTRDQWGDYLLYRFYPTARVYMDGRSDFYGNDFLNEYGKVMAAAHGWDNILAGYGVDRVLVPVDQPIAAVLKSTRGWRVLYDDHKAILFAKCTPAPEEKHVLSLAEARRADRDRAIAVSDRREPKFAATTNRDPRITSPNSL